MAKKPRIACVSDATILAAVRGYFRYDHEWQAIEMLEKIHTDFIRSKLQSDTPPCDYQVKSIACSVTLWVRGYNVTKEEKAAHYRGNFVRLAIAPADAGKWTIAAEKIDIPLAKHPEKERPKAAHPNWGHPVLRAVETAKKFDGIEIARAFLHSLHHEYPDATIPGKDVVHVMVYNRKLDEGAPIQKITVKVKPLSDGGAKLMLMKKKPKGKKLPISTTPQPDEGKFTVMVKKRRK